MPSDTDDEEEEEEGDDEHNYFHELYQREGREGAMHLENGENWLRLVVSSSGQQNDILQDILEDTQQEETPHGTPYPSILSLSNVGSIDAPNKECYLCLDVDDSYMTIKDMRTRTLASDKDDDDDEEEFEICIQRQKKRATTTPLRKDREEVDDDDKKKKKESAFGPLERLHRRQLRVLLPGDRICTRCPIEEEVGLVLTYRRYKGVHRRTQYAPSQMSVTMRRNLSVESMVIESLEEEKDDEDEDQEEKEQKNNSNNNKSNETQGSQSSVETGPVVSHSIETTASSRPATQDGSRTLVVLEEGGGGGGGGEGNDEATTSICDDDEDDPEATQPFPIPTEFGTQPSVGKERSQDGNGSNDDDDATTLDGEQETSELVFDSGGMSNSTQRLGSNQSSRVDVQDDLQNSCESVRKKLFDEETDDGTDRKQDKIQAHEGGCGSKLDKEVVRRPENGVPEQIEVTEHIQTTDSIGQQVNGLQTRKDTENTEAQKLHTRHSEIALFPKTGAETNDQTKDRGQATRKQNEHLSQTELSKNVGETIDKVLQPKETEQVTLRQHERRSQTEPSENVAETIDKELQPKDMGQATLQQCERRSQTGPSEKDAQMIDRELIGEDKRQETGEQDECRWQTASSEKDVISGTTDTDGRSLNDSTAPKSRVDGTSAVEPQETEENKAETSARDGEPNVNEKQASLAVTRDEQANNAAGASIHRDKDVVDSPQGTEINIEVNPGEGGEESSTSTVLTEVEGEKGAEVSGLSPRLKALKSFAERRIEAPQEKGGEEMVVSQGDDEEIDDPVKSEVAHKLLCLGRQSLDVGAYGGDNDKSQDVPKPDSRTQRSTQHSQISVASSTSRRESQGEEKKFPQKRRRRSSKESTGGAKRSRRYEGSTTPIRVLVTKVEIEPKHRHVSSVVHAQ